MLVEDFYNYFINLYHKAGSHKPGESILAFEAIGSSLTPDMFDLNTGEFSQNLAIEQFSNIANNVPILEGNTIVADFSMMVMGSMKSFYFRPKAFQGQTRPSLSTSTAKLLKSLMEKRGSMLNTGREYWPAVATPADWCAPGSLAGWSHKVVTRN
jgi:hypothetical protein